MDRNPEIRYTVPDYHGNPTSVPASMVEAFLKAQDRLREKEARGESTEIDPEKLDRIFEDFERFLKKKDK